MQSTTYISQPLNLYYSSATTGAIKASATLLIREHVGALQATYSARQQHLCSAHNLRAPSFDPKQPTLHLVFKLLDLLLQLVQQWEFVLYLP